MLNLLRLDEKSAAPDPEPSPQLSLFEETLGAAPEAVPHFLPDIDEHRQTIIGRETFIASLIVHVALILLLATHPDLINVGAAKIVPVKPEEKQVTMLYEPPPERPKLPPPPVQPKTLPRADGTRDSELEKLVPPPANRLIQPAQPRQPESPRGPQDREQQQTERQTEPAGIPKFPEMAKEPPKQQPSLESLPKLKETPPPSEAQLRLPEIAPPSRGTDSILREMAKQRAEGGGKGQGGGMSFPADPNNPNFNLPGPQILSDTMGVDFDPYLLRVYLIVRRKRIRQLDARERRGIH